MAINGLTPHKKSRQPYILQQNHQDVLCVHENNGKLETLYYLNGCQGNTSCHTIFSLPVVALGGLHGLSYWWQHIWRQQLEITEAADTHTMLHYQISVWHQPCSHLILSFTLTHFSSRSHATFCLASSINPSTFSFDLLKFSILKAYTVTSVTPRSRHHSRVYRTNSSTASVINASIHSYV